MTHNIRWDDTSFDVPLDPFTNYSCTVSAATVVGDGPATAVISGVTDEDSECSQSPLVHSLSPGLLLSSHNEMESLSAISSTALLMARQINP